MKIAIQLTGGEQDGFRDNKLDVGDGGHPALIYIWHTVDDSKMNTVQGDARRVLADKLGVLAYRFKEAQERPDGVVEYRYERYPRADKKTTSV